MGICETSETTVHDITYYEYNVMLFKCDGRNRLAQGGALSQLVMRSFDVSDKGEVNKGEGPLGRRGERTPDHHQQRRGKANKEEKSVGRGRKQHYSIRTGRKRVLLRDN